MYVRFKTDCIIFNCQWLLLCFVGISAILSAKLEISCTLIYSLNNEVFDTYLPLSLTAVELRSGHNLICKTGSVALWDC